EVGQPACGRLCLYAEIPFAAHYLIPGLITNNGLEEPNRAAVLVDVDVERRRRLAQSRHLHDVAAQRHQPPRPGVGADVADREGEVLWRVEQRRVRRQREM